MLKSKNKIYILALHLGIGGVESSIAFLSNMLSKKYDVTIICTYKLSNTPLVKLNNNVKVEYLTENIKPNKEEFISALKQRNIKSIFREGFLSIKILFLKKYTMIKKIKKLDDSLIISTRYTFSKLLGKYGKKDCIKIAQEHNHHNNNKKYIKKVIKSLKNIDYFMPVSQELTDFYSKIIKNKKTKCYYIPHGIEHYPKKCTNIEKKQIVSVGRLDPIKGFIDLIEIFKKLEKQYPEWTLNIVGDGKQYNELNAKIDELHLKDKVFLLGNKTREELNKIYSNSSIYVMTSHSESFGLVLLEAESFGIPLVAYDSAQGAKEIIKNAENGFLVSNRDVAEIVSKISALIDNVELRYNMGQTGRNLAKNHTEEKIEEKWEIFLNKV